MQALFEPSERGKGVLYGACGGIWIMLMYAPPVVKDMLLARSALKTMKRKYPTGFPTLTWVLTGAGYSMDSETRTAASEVTSEYTTSILAQATLIEGVGFKAAAVRAIISGIDVMSRSKSPKKVFDLVRPSVDWCLSLAAPGQKSTATPEEITASLEATRMTLV